jgi:N-acetylmannosamine-6-phosphate 2-epimerase/N-acetylmannosamine kinase
MRIAELLKLLKESPLVASVQADEGAPLDDPATIWKLAESSLSQGVKVLRLQGVENIRYVRERFDGPIIGLIKKQYQDSEVYITPTSREVEALIELGCEAIALDSTPRKRPNGEDLTSLIHRIHLANGIAVADCDSMESCRLAVDSGADLVSTTLSGYTPDSPPATSPNFELVREASKLGRPVLAEGRYIEPWQVEAALMIGAQGIVIGGALNDPIKQTKRFVSAANHFSGPVGAVDIGGTWMRYGFFDAEGKLIRKEQIETLQTAKERLEWIANLARKDKVIRVGISTGGTVAPGVNLVVESKPSIPDNERCLFLKIIGGSIEHVQALNDGLATAWGHYCHPQFAGKRVATLALGTGVGFGLVDKGQILMGQHGGYPRINDVPTVLGETFEELLGGAALTPDPTPTQKLRAIEAGHCAVQLINSLFYPDEIVVCGGVGLCDWMDLGLPKSPYGADAGLYGAAALVRFRPF